MEIERKIKIGKRWIFAAVFLASLMAIWSEVITPRIYPALLPDPQSITIGLLGILISSGYLYGLYLCSRAVGVPLTVMHFIRLTFGFPSWIPIVIVVACRALFT